MESGDLVCSEGLVKMEKLSDNSIACITPSTAEKLVKGGWGTYL